MCLSGTAPQQGGCLKRGATGRTCRAQCTSREKNCTRYCLDEEAGKIAEEEAVHAVHRRLEGLQRGRHSVHRHCW